MELGEIALVDVEPRPIAVECVTTVLARWPSQFRRALDTVYAEVRAGRVRQHGQNVMVYRPRSDGRVDIECGVEVEGRFQAVGDVVYRETPSGAAATTTHFGPYRQLSVSHAAVTDWCRQGGYRLSGPCWEIYGDWREDPATLRTDIFHLVSC